MNLISYILLNTYRLINLISYNFVDIRKPIVVLFHYLVHYYPLFMGFLLFESVGIFKTKKDNIQFSRSGDYQIIEANGRETVCQFFDIVFF